jgi:methionyl-tRNA formyltransferase
LQPVKLKDPEFLDTLRSLKADLQVVVAFRMLPEVVWNMPPLGTMNLHGSLLPATGGQHPLTGLSSTEKRKRALLPSCFGTR